MSKVIWNPVSERLPVNGQVVLVKMAKGRLEHRVTFYSTPTPRWENRNFIAELDLYQYWRPLPAEPKRRAADAHAAAL